MRTFEKIDPTELSLAPFAAISQGWQLVCGVKPDGTYNALTASWGALGTLWGMPVALCFIRSSRYTKEFIDAGDKITFSLFSPDEHRDELMVMGRTSGRDCDKIAKSWSPRRTSRRVARHPSSNRRMRGPARSCPST